MEQSPSSEANSHSYSQEIPCLYGTQMFITVFTRACQVQGPLLGAEIFNAMCWARLAKIEP